MKYSFTRFHPPWNASAEPFKISQSLGTRLRREGQAALLDILNLAHNVKGEGVDTQGRQGHVHAFAVEGIDQECYKLFQTSVVTGA